MSEKHPVLTLTDRGQRHQEATLDAAPTELAVTMMRRPPKEEILRVLPDVEFLISECSGSVDTDVLMTSCPACLMQFQQTRSGVRGRPRVMDITAIIWNHMVLPGEA